MPGATARSKRTPGSRSDDGRYQARGRAQTYNRVGYGLKKFSKAATNAMPLLSVRDAKICVVGPSTAQGIGAGTNATVPAWRSWPQMLAGFLNAGLQPATTGLGVPKSASSAALADTRWTPGTGWSLAGGTQGGIGAGNRQAYYLGAGVTSGPLVYADSTILADRFDVYFIQFPSTGGTVSATATGGSAVTVDTSTGGSGVLNKLTVLAASAATTNTVSITSTVSGKSVYVIGVEPWLSTSTRIRIGNMAVSGSTTYDWAYERNSTTFWGGPSFIKAYAPDLTIIDLALLLNDLANGVSTANSIAYLQTIIAAAQVSGDVLLKAPMPLATINALGVSPAQEATVLSTIISVFPTLPYIDTFTALGGNADAYAASGDMAADTTHGGNAIYGDEAQMLAAFFRTL